VERDADLGNKLKAKIRGLDARMGVMRNRRRGQKREKNKHQKKSCVNRKKL